MPIIDVYSPAGLLPDGSARPLAERLARSLLRWEGAPLADPYLENTHAYVHELPAAAVHTAGTAGARTVRVQVLTPPGALDRAAQQGLVAEATSIVADLVGDPDQAVRTSVILTEAAEGGWGVAGFALGRDELTALRGRDVRQLVYVEPGRVEWQEAPDPELTGPTDVLVRPLAVARCDLDQPMAALGIFPGPFPVGHELAAEVVAVGDAVTGHRPGDRVVVPFQVSCGACVACRGGRFAACHPRRARAGAAFGFGVDGGGHGGAVADLVLVPDADHLLLAAPAHLSAVTLCTLADNVVDGYRTVGPQLLADPGADVLVVGSLAASVGLYAAAWAVALGAGHVRYVDPDPARGALAEAFGAEVLAHEGPWPRRFDRAPITVDNTGDADGLTAVLRSTDDYGTCTGVAIHFTPTTPVPLLELYTRGITFHTSRADSRRFLPEVLDHVAAGRFDPAVVTPTVRPWDDADATWLEPATKLVLERPTPG